MILHLPEDSTKTVIVIRDDGSVIEGEFMGELEIVTYIRQALEKRKQHRYTTAKIYASTKRGS